MLLHYKKHLIARDERLNAWVVYINCTKVYCKTLTRAREIINGGIVS